jgi:hypothetical protein
LTGRQKKPVEAGADRHFVLGRKPGWSRTLEGLAAGACSGKDDGRSPSGRMEENGFRSEWHFHQATGHENGQDGKAPSLPKFKELGVMEVPFVSDHVFRAN